MSGLWCDRDLLSRQRASVVKNGAPSKTRTCDLLVRSQTLYPTELWARTKPTLESNIGAHEPSRSQSDVAGLRPLLRAHDQRHAHIRQRHQRPSNRGAARSGGHQVSDRAHRPRRSDAIGALREQLDDPSAQVIITTGGTGITSRDSTYEVVGNLLEKRLDGFGELFRMLSFRRSGRPP